MNLTELQTFLTILETGSLVNASKRLNVTQSTITTRLKSLEDELGQVLINRQKSGITLTTSGERLRRYASTILELWKQAKQETALPRGINSVCNIGCHPDLWCNLGQRLFDHIRHTEPTVALSVWHGGQTDLDKWVQAGLIDVSLTYWPTAHGGQIVHPLSPDRLVLVSTTKDSPMKFDPDYIYVEAGETFGRQHAAAYSDAGTAKLSFGTAQLGVEHILENGGSAYLPYRIAKTFIQEHRLFQISHAPEFQRNIYMVLNKNAAQDWSLFNVITEDGTEFSGV